VDKHEEFRAEVAQNIQGLSDDKDVQALSRIWVREISRHKYAYNFSWFGRPAIQFPQDMIAMQELIATIQPSVIIETGIAHGGSLLFSASMLELSAICGGPQDAEVLGIDIDIREHNRQAIEAHPLAKRVSMIEGSSIDDEIVAQVKARVAGKGPVIVCLDSNHTHDHVLAELNAYAPLVTPGSYCVTFDTIVEDLPQELCGDRPWGPGNSPKTAVHEFLKTNDQFEIDRRIDAKLLISVAPDGFLKRVA
jgi:cephalosporin hydroxylase